MTSICMPGVLEILHRWWSTCISSCGYAGKAQLLPEGSWRCLRELLFYIWQNGAKMVQNDRETLKGKQNRMVHLNWTACWSKRTCSVGGDKMAFFSWEVLGTKVTKGYKRVGSHRISSFSSSSSPSFPSSFFLFLPSYSFTSSFLKKLNLRSFLTTIITHP